MFVLILERTGDFVVGKWISYIMDNHSVVVLSFGFYVVSQQKHLVAAVLWRAKKLRGRSSERASGCKNVGWTSCHELCKHLLRPRREKSCSEDHEILTKIYTKADQLIQGFSKVHTYSGSQTPFSRLEGENHDR